MLIIYNTSLVVFIYKSIKNVLYLRIIIVLVCEMAVKNGALGLTNEAVWIHIVIRFLIET